MKLRNILIAGWIAGLMISCGCNRRLPQAQAAAEETTPQAVKPIANSAAANIAKDIQSEKNVIWETPVPQPNEYQDYVPLTRQSQEITLTCTKLDSVPVIDGYADEAVWNKAQAITTLDFSSQRPIELRAFHDGQMIYVLARYPDGAPSESHKSWFWDPQEQVYKPGQDREDMLVLKWLMTGDSLCLAADKVAPHTADVWFWKAARTNPAGYVDDKIDTVSTQDGKEAAKLKSDQYGTLYLYRPGDHGQCAYTEAMAFEYRGECVAGFAPAVPGGSRADVRAKGVWKDGFWTIEMSRKLNTQNADDVAFEVGGKYVFAATLYEMAGSGVNREWWQPLYRTGDAFDKLVLEIQ